MTAEWDLGELLGYLGTWSSVQRYIDRHRSDPIALVEADLGRAWGRAETTHVVRWPLFLRAGRIDSTA